MSVEDAMQELASPRLKIILFLFINVIYNFNSVFIGAIPFLTVIPPFMPVRYKGGEIMKMKTEEACSHTLSNDYTVEYDDKYNTWTHYHNPITRIQL
jgi:hypothetical protein